ncbi:GGDEF domain-containing protein [Acetobacterium wieringae]|uniref:GGDEF domain-containing protein n=1 Tax=Acetobacterium wieringae TaxID=52694 RepID=A0A5D0WK35_9FIRM|nr:GGDEF domain-containing protein [Acetobacterium wieringae]
MLYRYFFFFPISCLFTLKNKPVKCYNMSHIIQIPKKGCIHNRFMVNPTRMLISIKEASILHLNKNWYTHIITYLWIAIGVSSSVTLLNLFFSSLAPQSFLLERFLFPLLLEVIILIVLKKLIRLNTTVTPYFIIVGCQAIVMILFMVHYPVFYVMLSLFLMPVLISIFFLDLKLIDFSFYLSLAVFVGMKLLFPPLSMMSVIEVTTFSAILVSAYFLSRELTKRFSVVYTDMVISVEKEKELLYRNIYMEKLTKMDLATNLYNHKTFHEYLDELVAQCRKQPFNLSLGLMDLDRFKGINDRQGHGNGDKVIATAAAIIRDNLEANDFAARYGGEEFAVIFTEKSPEACLEILERIRTDLETAVFDTMPDEVVTMSIGFTPFTPKMSKTDLFEAADASLYSAKKNGRNQIQCAS